MEVLKNPTSEQVANTLKNIWISRFGPPREIVVDNGKQFTGAPFFDLCKKRNIKIRYCSPYNPTANGISEILNQTLGVVFRTNKNKNLNIVLEIAEKALNSTFHRTIGTTPELALIGRSNTDPLNRRRSVKLEDISQRIETNAVKETERNNSKRKPKKILQDQ